MAPYATGETALVVAVPEAEPVVGRWRARHDEAAGHGVPAHVTVLYPFLREEEVDAEALAGIVGAEPRFEVRFASCARFPGGVLYLEPVPADPFRRLTEAVAGRWPQAPPYGGQFAEVVPHLTVAHTADPATLDVVEADVASRLPVEAWVTAVELLVFDGARWIRRRTFQLAGGDAQ